MNHPLGTTLWARQAWKSARHICKDATKLLTVATLLALALSGTLSIVHAAPGDLDPTFGGTGIVLTNLGGHDTANAVVVQADGKIIVAGHAGSETSHNFAIVRYTTSGALDTTFNGTGSVIVDFGGDDVLVDVVCQSGGALLVLGHSNAGGNHNFVVGRFTAAGVLDTSFGTSGWTTIDFGGTDTAGGMTIQSDGSIVVVGSGGPSPRNFAIARLTITGALDPTFGTGGKVLTDFAGGEDVAEGVAERSDGTLVVVGSMNIGGSGDFAVARYTATGVLDTTFDTDGRVTVNAGGSDSLFNVAILSSGRILAGGSGGSGKDFVAIRLLVNGALDTTFGVGGFAYVDFGGIEDNGQAMAVNSGEEPIIAGYTIATGGVVNTAAAKLLANGAPDTGFGVAGRITVDAGALDVALGIAIQSDGKVVTAGYANGGSQNEIAVIRLAGTSLGPIICSPLCGFDNPAATPELSSLALFGSGAASMAAYAWTRVRGVRLRKRIAPSQA